MTQRIGRIPIGVLVLAWMCVASFAAIARTASATPGDPNHVSCVAHGFYPGGSTSDGSYFSRVSPGCGSSYYYCGLLNGGRTLGSQEAYGTTTCNAWSNDFGDTTECRGAAQVYDQGVFATHSHYATSPC